jgi:hypothetical protein
MAEMKPGLRLKSVVCSGEAMVVKAGDGSDLILTCGGEPMSTESEVVVDPSKANPDHMFDCLIGKRYVNEEETIELLCVKAGEGSFGVDGQMLMGKETKKLPSSD